MGDSKTTFGGYLSNLREKRNVTLRELSRKIDVSAAFLSDVEKRRRAPLTAERLEKVVAALNLTREEETRLYDLAGEEKKTIAPDLPEYIMGRDYVSAALRTARDLDAGEDEWMQFVEDLKNRRG